MTPAKQSGISRRALDADTTRLVRECVAERSTIDDKINRLKRDRAQLSNSSLARKLDVSECTIRRIAQGGYA
jgi:ribosome-binding protein aMBF1 (putative translation factor)